MFCNVAGFELRNNRCKFSTNKAHFVPLAFDQSVPLPRGEVEGPVVVVRDEVDHVVEADLVGDVLEEVHAEALKPKTRLINTCSAS